jgi:aldehyde:ferredoxin oxidoreductase
LIDIARETLRLETEFNKRAGFTEAEDELPSFFADEPLPPTNRTARMFAREVNVYMKEFSADKTLVIT